ncbi:ATP-binding protein [Anabaena azotica]|uniref:ATP-binding protein n=1 Tax=Anabaena azotica TaxID=197653 RepID=UPI0039A4C0C4
MTSIDEIILRSINPFGNVRSVNFWNKQQPEPTIDSIHQEAITKIETTLDQVVQDHQTRTIILDGEAGCGKTYLLGRLKKKFNHKAFFVYIPPFPETDRIWRHILRCTVDSLVQVPEGQKDSQLLLWVENVLTSIKERSVKDRIFKDDVLDLLRNERGKFINKLRDIYKKAGISIYNADVFFGVLHDLTNTELYPLACEWLRGDDLSEDSLKTLGIKKSIDTEESATENLRNFSRIAGDTQPIVLCFDQLESIALLPDGRQNLQALFNVNTIISGQNSNLLIIISIATDTWKQNKSRINESHKDRIDEKIDLKSIDLKQAESLLSSRLCSLHHQAHPQPSSPIYPLTRQYLEEEFPGGKTKPREIIIFGKDVIQQYKQWLAGGRKGEFKPDLKCGGKRDDSSELIADFKLKWRDEFNKVQYQITKIRHFSAPDLIKMLQEALETLQVEGVKYPLFTGTKYASYSLEYKLSDKSRPLGVVWTEDGNMTTFFHVMEACKKAAKKDSTLTLYLIRAEVLGNTKNQGYQSYTAFFTGSPHRHITPHINSVHYLVTYHNLVKDAREGDLVIGSKNLNFKSLQELIRESNILEGCSLLQDLGIFKKIIPPPELTECKDYLFNLVTTHHFLGRQTLIDNAISSFPTVNEDQINVLIKQLCEENKIQILDPKAKPKSQLICLVPHK